MTEQNDSFEDLVAYAMGELDGDAARSLERQLADSPALQADLTAIRRILELMRADDTVLPQEHVTQRVIRLFRERAEQYARSILSEGVHYVARLIFDSRAEPALTGFRGRGEGYHLMFASEIGEVDLQVMRRSAAASELLEVRGQVSASAAPPTIVRLTRREDRETARVARTDQRGAFGFDAQPGRYDLRIELAEKTLVVEDVHFE